LDLGQHPKERTSSGILFACFKCGDGARKERVRRKREMVVKGVATFDNSGRGNGGGSHRSLES